MASNNRRVFICTETQKTNQSSSMLSMLTQKTRNEADEHKNWKKRFLYIWFLFLSLSMWQATNHMIHSFVLSFFKFFYLKKLFLKKSDISPSVLSVLLPFFLIFRSFFFTLFFFSCFKDYYKNARDHTFLHFFNSFFLSFFLFVLFLVLKSARCKDCWLDSFSAFFCVSMKQATNHTIRSIFLSFSL